MLINAGFTFFPALLGVVYYVIVSASRLKNVPQPAELGSKVLASLLAFPNSEWINLGEIRLLLLILGVLLIARFAYDYSNAPKGGKDAGERLNMLGISILAVIGIFFSPIIVKTLFTVLSAAEGSIMGKLMHLLSILGGEVFFIVPMTALTLLRYFILALLAVILPFALMLCVLRETRGLGGIIMEQAFIWTFASDIALVLLIALEAFAALPEAPGQIPPLYLAMIGAAIVVVSPPITLLLLSGLEKMLSSLLSAVIYEFKETYGGV